MASTANVDPPRLRRVRGANSTSKQPLRRRWPKYHMSSCQEGCQGCSAPQAKAQSYVEVAGGNWPPHIQAFTACGLQPLPENAKSRATATQVYMECIWKGCSNQQGSLGAWVLRTGRTLTLGGGFLAQRVRTCGGSSRPSFTETFADVAPRLSYQINRNATGRLRLRSLQGAFSSLPLDMLQTRSRLQVESRQEPRHPSIQS